MYFADGIYPEYTTSGYFIFFRKEMALWKLTNAESRKLNPERRMRARRIFVSSLSGYFGSICWHQFDLQPRKFV